MSFPPYPACGQGPGAAASLALAGLLLGVLGRTDGELLDEVVEDYLEDAPDARPVAEVRARLLRRGEGLHAGLLVSAQGARVVAAPGLEGVRGHNLRTAEEMHRLLRDGRLRFVIRGGEPVSELEGRVLVVRTGALPRRSVEDGVLRMRDETEAEWPLELAFEAGPLVPGTWVGHVLVGDVPRLSAVFEVGAGRGRIEEVRSMGQFHEPGRSR